MVVTEFDTTQFIQQLENAKNLLTTAAKLGEDLAHQGYNNLIFVGCGAPNRIVRLIQHYCNLKIKNTLISSYLPAEFIHTNPSFLSDQTLVIFGSYSGTTKETVDAAIFCQSKPGLSLSITRFDDSPLSQAVDSHLNYGDTKLGDYSRFMVTSAFISGFLMTREPDNWSFHNSMIQSLHALPKALANVVKQSEEKVKTFSERYQNSSSLFVVGHGPLYNTAYVLAFCSYMEMQWMHATPIIAAEFFHGPFELLDDSFPLIIMLGEDETRPESDRVVQFCKNHLKEYIVFDSKDYDLIGIDSNLRSYFSGIVVDAATRRLMDYVAILRDHDKTIRRYMGVVDY